MVDPPPLDLIPRPVRAGRIVSSIRVRSLRPTEGSAKKILGKVPGRVVGVAYDTPFIQLPGYLGMEFEQFGCGQVFEIVRLFSHFTILGRGSDGCKLMSLLAKAYPPKSLDF